MDSAQPSIKKSIGRCRSGIRIKIKSPGRLIVLSILAVVLGLKLYSWNSGSLTGDSMPMPFGYGMSVVLSGSMDPVLKVDDLVFIHETKDITAGDIIVYERDGALIIHRVLSIDGDTVITKGDANNVEDEPVDISMVKGKMTGRIQGAGALIRKIKTPFGTMALLAAAVLLVEISYRRDKMQDGEDLEAIKEEIESLKKARIDRELEDK
jgi:signal peptidase